MLTQTALMSSQPTNNWRQPVDPHAIIVENLDDIIAAINGRQAMADLRLWSPPDAASSHGVLWFLSLQQATRERFRGAAPEIVFDCGDRADFAHAALREGIRAICFRGSAGMLAKLRAIASDVGAVIETQHPALADLLPGLHGSASPGN